MKTLMGARLNDMRSREQQGNTFAQAAFRWTLANPHVDALIVSMTGTDQIDEYLGASGAHSVGFGDVELLRDYAHLNGATYCKHACNQCEGACPFGVPIADVLRTRMYATDYKDVAFAKAEYGMPGMPRLVWRVAASPAPAPVRTASISRSSARPHIECLPDGFC